MLPQSPSSDAGSADDGGSAALEFILVGLLLLVPLVYLVVTLGIIQGQTLGTEAGARHAARTIATSSDIDEARDHADLVLAAVADAYGIDQSRLALSVTCRPVGVECPSAGATIFVTVRTAVPLPLVPPVLGLDQVMTVPIEATAVQKVSRFWGVEE